MSGVSGEYSRVQNSLWESYGQRKMLKEESYKFTSYKFIS